MANDVQVSDFTITELSGAKRRVVLRGRGLPFRPFELDTTQRNDATWLPGSPQATITVLGAKEEPGQISGYWKDRYVGDTGNSGLILLNNAPVRTVKDARTLFDSIVRAGQFIEVTWLDERRRGIMETFKKKWHNEHDLEWEIKFIWADRGEPNGPTAFVSASSFGDVASAYRTSLDSLTAVRLPNAPVNNPFLAALSQFVNLIDDAVLAIEASISQFTQAQLVQNSVIQSMLGASSTIVNQCKQMASFMGATVSEFIIFAPVEDQTPAERIQGIAWERELLRQINAMKHTALVQQQLLAAQLRGQILGSFLAREGDDLRDVSKQFYQTPFEWRRIMIFNGLNETELYAGQLVLVPKINPAELVDGAFGNATI